MKRKAFYYVVTAAYVFAVLFPVYWLVSTSFKTHLLTFAIPPAWIFEPTLKNYQEVFLMRNFTPYMRNSIVVAATSSMIAAMVGSIAAYSFSRYQIKRSNDILYFLLSTKMLPPIAVVIPMFVFMRFLGLANNVLSLIILYVAMNLPFAVWMMKGFFDAMPREPEESALIDGCSAFASFFRIALPQVVGGIFATFIFIFIYAWNEFIFALVLTYTDVSQTIPVWAAGGLTTYRGIMWGESGVVGTVAMIPVLIFAILVRKYLIRGITFGMIKG